MERHSPVKFYNSYPLSEIVGARYLEDAVYEMHKSEEQWLGHIM